MKQALLFKLVVVAWGMAFIYGYVIGFVPENATTNYSIYGAIPFCLFFLLPVVKWALNFSTAGNSSKIDNPIKRAILVLIAIPFAYIYSLLGLSVGWAAVATKALGEQFSAIYITTAKGDDRPRLVLANYCDRYRIVISTPDRNWSARVCREERMWQVLKVGDTVVGNGRRSRLGTLIENIEPNG